MALCGWRTAHVDVSHVGWERQTMSDCEAFVVL